MNLALVYDTETQGLPDFGAPSESAHQPHIVQLAACLVDLDTQKVHGSMDVTVRPDGWVIPDEVAGIHGITTEHALAVGIPERMAVQMFLDLWAGRERIGHNESFDARILRIATMRFCDTTTQELWKGGKARCTQLLSTPILKLPPTEKMRKAGRFHHKSANLGEAYQHFTGKPLEGAHSAMVDVQACMTVFFAITAPQREAVAA